MTSQQTKSIAVIGAGIAGATAAHALAHAGHTVQVFDKARGAGGRLATRRLAWVDREGQARTTRLDHGAVGFQATSPAFLAFADQARQAGWLAPWTPRLADGSEPIDGGGRLLVPLPDMPALCRQLLDGLACTWSVAVDSLRKGPRGWQLQSAGTRLPGDFDAVVLALPPAQAAPLLSAHRLDWARNASIAPMQPCWTLMGISDGLAQPPAWDACRPPSGPLAWVLRNEARPGRAAVAGQAHWVAHARPGWSRRHLEQPAAWVQQQLQTALADVLDQDVAWQHCTVHRWRYAQPLAHTGQPAATCWWDAPQGLGVCGDFLGGNGVEGAWLSAHALVTAITQPGAQPAAGASAAAAASRQPGQPGRPGRHVTA